MTHEVGFKQFDFEQFVRFSLAGVNHTLQALLDQQCEMRNGLAQLITEVSTLSQGISQLDSTISSLASQDASLQTLLATVSADILAAVQSLQSKLAAVAGSAPSVDLTNEVASLSKIGTDLGTIASGLSGLQTSVDAATTSTVSNTSTTSTTSTSPSTASSSTSSSF